MTIANVSQVQKVGDGKNPQRIRACTDEVADILNSLLLRGDIQRVSPDAFKINGGGGGGINGWEAPFTPPLLAGVTQVNNSGFTSSDDTNGLFVVYTGTLSATDNLCLTHVAVPGTAVWKLVIRIQSLWGDDASPSGGAHLYESATGKVVTWGMMGQGAINQLGVNNYNSVTSFNANVKNVNLSGRATWLRIVRNPINYIFSWSMDGLSWVQFGPPVAHAAFFTTEADFAGFFLNPNTAGYITGIKCMSLTCA